MRATCGHIHIMLSHRGEIGDMQSEAWSISSGGVELALLDHESFPILLQFRLQGLET